MYNTALIFRITLLLNLITALAFSRLTAQQPGTEASLSFRKLYLHTDREYYFNGDTLWFKSYYLDGQTNQFVPGFMNMFTDLLDEEGNTILQQVLRIDQGETSGSMIIPDSLEPGNYLLRAFTYEQKSVGEDAFFHKTLRISRVRSTLDQPGEQVPVEEMEIDLAILPEGGILLEGIDNVVAIKSIDRLGRDLPVNGTITDGRGNITAAFSTTYKGMDTIHFLPEAGEAYRVHIDGYPDFEKLMEKPAERGVRIGFSGESEDQLLFNVSTNSTDYTGKEYYFAIMHHGSVIFDQRFGLRDMVFSIRVNRTALPPGINRFILLDLTMKPISERLYFSWHPVINPVRVLPDRQLYGTRSPVTIDLYDGEETGGNAFSHLSVSVVDVKAVPENGPGVDMLSWLLVSSELKGRIESPSDFFRDDEMIAAEEKLDLLMLTHGWSRYLWNDLSGLASDVANAGNEDHMLNDGFSLSGAVTNPLTHRPLQNADVLLSIFSPEIFFLEETVTDGEGRFLVENVLFEDTATAFVQARNRRGNLYTDISLDPVLEPFPELPGAYRPVPGLVTAFPAGLNEQQYYNDRALQEYLIKSGAIMLEEVTIIEKRREDDGHYRIYSMPSNSLKVKEIDYSYRNVTDYLAGRVSGLTVVGDRIMIRGPGSFRPGPPLFVLDGTPLIGEDANSIINSIPMSSIDVVEVLKNPSEAGIFGVNAGNGVISVFTKKGVDPYDDTFRQGTITRKIEGYARYREFYSPEYSSDNLDSERPDRRITLFWDPEIVTADGKATLSFFTSDDVARYRIYVEGITQTGEVCLGNASFTVENDQPVLIE